LFASFRQPLISTVLAVGRPHIIHQPNDMTPIFFQQRDQEKGTAKKKLLLPRVCNIFFIVPAQVC
jgi:hypothetical protein